MRAELAELLASRWPGSTATALTGDASTRRFFRVTLPSGETAVVMDYGRPFEGESDDQRLERIFRAGGLPIAAIRSAHPDPGCLILEDLGDRTLETELNRVEITASRPKWLDLAVDLAARLRVDGTRALAASDRSDGPALDVERLTFEMDFFLENYVGRFRRIDPPGGALRTRLSELAERAATTPRSVLCHRDFHSRNLMITPNGLAMVDIQDARWGPDTYDLASLLFDAYVDLADAWRDASLQRFASAVGEVPTALATRCHTVACQRMIKALGTFGYQVAVAGNRRYFDAIQRTVDRLGAILAESSETSELFELFCDLDLFAAPPRQP